MAKHKLEEETKQIIASEMDGWENASMHEKIRRFPVIMEAIERFGMANADTFMDEYCAKLVPAEEIAKRFDKAE